MKIILITYLSNNAKKKLLPIIKQIKRKYDNKPIFIQFVSKNKLKIYSYKNNYKQINNGDFEFEQNDLTIFYSVIGMLGEIISSLKSIHKTKLEVLPVV